MKKSIFLFFAAILCATSAWAHNLAASQYVYFEKPADWSNVSLLLGHNSWSQGYNMTKITNTNLYYWKTDKWDGYTRYCFIDATGWGGEDKKPDDRKGYASHSTNVFTNQLIKYHLFTSSGSKSSHATDRKIAINRTQTIKVQLKDGSNWVATVVPADLTASTYAMTDNSTAVSAASASLAKESTTVSATVDAAYSATVTLSCTNVLDGYMFEGWYNANGDKITSYTVSDADTVYARFIQSAEETNEVSVTYMCDATEVSPAIAEIVGVETEKSFTAPTVTGYNFTGWTIGAGIDLKAGTASDATITVVTKSASSGYTLVANYEEVIETVYFINAGNWADVHIHLWNGTATGTEWPGTQLTATSTKIGEYDVYEYTAQQGAHANLLFHKKDNDSQKTTDLTWSEGVDKYYIHNYNGNTGWYTQAEAEAILVAPVVEETVYFVNNKNWTKVQVHAWKDAANNGWPGQALTATGEKVAGFDVYSFTAPQGTYTNLLFNNKEGDAGVQSNNFVWTADKYYYMGAAADYAGGTKEDVTTAVVPDPLATEVYLAGDMTNKDNWDVNKKEFRKATADATNASVTVTLEVQTYKFKLVVDGAWKGNTGTMQRGGDAVHEGGWSFDKDGYDDNCQIVADIAGDYTFTWNLTDKKLTVAYPPLPKYQVTTTAENGSVTGAGEYEQGSEATLVATPDAGYAFKNWTKGGEEVSTEATYTFTVTANVELVANFEAAADEVHNVTVSYVCGGNKIADDQTISAVGVTTPQSVEAPAIFGYTFASWTLGAGVTSTNELTSNTIDINTIASGSDFTLTANYTEIPKVTVYFVNNKKWSKVNVYGWKEGEAQGTPGWPGNNITANKEAEQVAGFDVYSYSVVPGSYDNIIFNNKEGDSGEQTETFKWTDGKYYYVDATKNYAGGTAEEVATALGSIVTYDYYVIGTVNSWTLKDANFGMTDDNADGVYEKVVTLADGKNQMKINNGTWDKQAGYDQLDAKYEGVSRGTSGDDNNIIINIATGKDITVKFDKNANKITLDGLTKVETETLVYYVEVPEGTEDCYIAGQMNDWDFVRMTQVDATHWTITYDNVLETTEYKYACQADWDYVEKKTDGNNLENNRTWTELDKVEKWGKPAVPTLMGIGDDWTTGIEMTINPDNADEYMLLGQVIASAATVKIKYGDTWCATLEEGSAGTIVKDAMDQDNISLTAGTYDFYYKVTANKVYIKASIAVAIREDLTVGQWGTLCPTQNVENPTGATFYQIDYLEEKCGMPFNMHFYEVEGNLEAGQPYFFIASATEIKGIKSGEPKTEGSKVNGFYGYIGETSWTLPYQASFDATSDKNTFVIWNNSVFRINAATDIKSERCYININLSEPSRVAESAHVGARRITMGVSGVNGQNTATGVDQVQGDNVPTKMIINGQLFILRGEKMYDAQGKLVK